MGDIRGDIHFHVLSLSNFASNWLRFAEKAMHDEVRFFAQHRNNSRALCRAVRRFHRANEFNVLVNRVKAFHLNEAGPAPDWLRVPELLDPISLIIIVMSLSNLASNRLSAAKIALQEKLLGAFLYGIGNLVMFFTTRRKYSDANEFNKLVQEVETFYLNFLAEELVLNPPPPALVWVNVDEPVEVLAINAAEPDGVVEINQDLAVNGIVVEEVMEHPVAEPEEAVNGWSITRILPSMGQWLKRLLSRTRVEISVNLHLKW